MVPVSQVVNLVLRKAREAAPAAESRSRIAATGALVLGASLFLAPHAFAQEASDALEEVTVTATRQASNVNKIPLAVTAVTQKTLEAQGVNDVNDLARTVPNVTFRKTGGEGNPVVSIRGVGGNGATVGSQTTGVYLDDSALQRRMINGLQTGNGSPFPELFDLDRVEVLRGPQGTLYGGSSEGGTIRFITPTPSLTTYSGQIRADVSNTEGGSPSYSGAAAIGGPIIDDVLGFRASFIHRYEGGWVDNKSMYDGTTFAKNTNWGTNDGFRGTLKWKVNDSLSLTPALYVGRDYSNDNNNVLGPSPEINYSGGTVYNGTGGCAKSGDSYPGLAFNTGTSPGGVCRVSVATFNPTNGQTAYQNYYFKFPNTVIQPFTVNAMPWYNFDSRSNGLYSSTDPATATATYVASPRTTNLLMPSLTIDKTFDAVTVKSITTYVHDETVGITFGGGGTGGRNLNRFMYGSIDCIPGGTTPRQVDYGVGGAVTGNNACFLNPSYVPASAVGTYADGSKVQLNGQDAVLPAYADWYNYHNTRNALSEELRFNGTAFNDRLSYVAGGFFTNSNIHMHGLEQNNENIYSEVIRGISENWGTYAVLPLEGVASPQPYTIDTPYQDISDRDVFLHEKEWAIFTELNFNITEKLKLTAGVRYASYSQDFNQAYGGAPAGNPPTGTNPLNVSATNPTGGFVTTADAVALASQAHDVTVPNSVNNPITDPTAIAALWASSDLATCPTQTACPLQYTSLSETEKTVSPKGGLSYQITDNHLVYFTYAKGYRPGGVNPPTSPTFCAADYARLGITETPLTYKQDNVDSYELGDKVRLLDGRMQLNTALFHIDWKGMQYNYSMGCGLAFVTNAGTVSSNGVEVEAASRFGPWTLGTNVAYNRAEFSKDLTVGNSAPLVKKGDGVGTPDWQLSANVQYDWLIKNIPGFFRADYNYTGASQRGPGPGSSGFNATTYMGPAYFTFNLRLGFTVEKIDWSLYVQNLANVQPLLTYGGGTSGSATVAGGDSARFTGSSITPRQIGIQANYRF